MRSIDRGEVLGTVSRALRAPEQRLVDVLVNEINIALGGPVSLSAAER